MRVMEAASFLWVFMFICFCHISDSDKCVKMASLSLAHLAQSNQLTWIQRLSSSENALFIPGLEDAAGGLLRRSLDNFTMDTSKGTRAQGLRGRWVDTSALWA